MSSVKDFLVSSPASQTPAPSYWVNLPVDSRAQPHRPVGNPRAQPASSEIPATAPLAGKSYPVQIRTELTRYYRYIGQIPSRKSLDRQVKQITVHYQDLKKLGFDIQDVTTFGLRHAKALLAKWQENQCAPTTVYPRWSILRTWSRVLGKHGMLGKLSEILPGFDRRSESGGIYRVLTLEQLSARSTYLESKPDLTVYFVDRVCRDLGLTREEALQVELDAVQTVIEGEADVLRVGIGNERKSLPNAQLHLALLTQLRDFIISRNRKTLAWSNLDLDGALQKYTLRLSYVTRTLFPDKQCDDKAGTKGGVA
ncbi:MAG: hypothetical protein H7293_14765 [Candidatus Saccharibacteria bacterium]|nr:hypothetical protein [Rhodoferax sp.]